MVKVCGQVRLIIIGNRRVLESVECNSHMVNEMFLRRRKECRYEVEAALMTNPL